MTPLWQISRNGAFWLLAAFVVSTLSLWPYLPAWLFLMALVSLLWQIAIYRGRWRMPGRGVKLLMMVFCGAGIQLSFRTLYGLEPMVALLVCGYSLKLLEMHQRRDALVVVYLGFFVAITLALFDQGLLTALNILFCVVFITTSLLALHDVGSHRVRLGSVWVGSKLLAQAFPLMLIFFMVMPRLGPLWAVPSANSATTGMSDNLKLGDITSLGTSPALAFRVDFDGAPPPRELLYWRGMTLSRFDGEHWTRSGWGYRGSLVQWQGEPVADWQRSIERGSDSFSYRVMLERQAGNWLYSLWLADPKTPGTGLARDMTLVSMMPPSSRFDYRVTSYPFAAVESQELNSLRRQVELDLPPTVNPQARQMAEQWARESSNTEVLIQRVLSYYNQQFSYTLRPPPLGVNSIDEFLFDTQEGFCEHFAASFVFFMRAAGVPARIVTGYQGGEFHPARGYLTVRQYDAHAWAEVWLPGRGWTQYDPTAAVAPERIRNSYLDMMSEEDVFKDSPFSLGRYRGINWMNQMRLQFDELEYQWGRWILGYDEVQQSFLNDILGGLDSWRIALFVLLGSLVALLPAIIWSLVTKNTSPRHPADAAYLRFCQRLAAAGCLRLPGEPPLSFARRSIAYMPSQRQAIDRITHQYVELRYRGQGDVAKLKSDVKRFRPAMNILWGKLRVD